jgi:hypothetical protein
MKLIPLTKGMFAKVDDADYDDLIQYKWKADKDGKTYYAYRRVRKNGKRHEIAMHRQILNTPVGVLVNHFDWDGLNNQRYNIKNCTYADNSRYVRPRSNTGFLGVSQDTYIKKDGTISIHYKVSIKCNGVVYRLGNHKDIEVAARAYDTKAKELFGEYANLNFK